MFGVSACVWMYFLTESTSKQTYGAAVLLGIGGSTMLVTSLSMTADMIGENTVRDCLNYVLKIIFRKFMTL